MCTVSKMYLTNYSMFFMYSTLVLHFLFSTILFYIVIHVLYMYILYIV